MSSIMLMTLQELCNNCASLARFPLFCFILFYFILVQSGKIPAQFLCKSFILFFLLHMGEPPYGSTLCINNSHLLEFGTLGTLCSVENGAKLYITRPYTAPPATSHVITLTQTVTLLFIQTVTVLRCTSYGSWNVNFHPKCNEQDVPLIIVTQKSKCMKVI